MHLTSYENSLGSFGHHNPWKSCSIPKREQKFLEPLTSNYQRNPQNWVNFDNLTCTSTKFYSIYVMEFQWRAYSIEKKIRKQQCSPPYLQQWITGHGFDLTKEQIQVQKISLRMWTTKVFIATMGSLSDNWLCCTHNMWLLIVYRTLRANKMLKSPWITRQKKHRKTEFDKRFRASKQGKNWLHLFHNLQKVKHREHVIASSITADQLHYKNWSSYLKTYGRETCCQLMMYGNCFSTETTCKKYT